MIQLEQTEVKCRYTVIETVYGEVKLIKSSELPSSNLETLRFPSLSECLEYINKNRFRIDILHSGRREKKPHPD